MDINNVRYVCCDVVFKEFYNLSKKYSDRILINVT
jgi:hypothetical protein